MGTKHQAHNQGSLLTVDLGPGTVSVRITRGKVRIKPLGQWLSIPLSVEDHRRIHANLAWKLGVSHMRVEMTDLVSAANRGAVADYSIKAIYGEYDASPMFF